MDSLLAEVTRGNRVESVHRGHVAIMSASGKLVGSVGDPDSIHFFRSCGKPFQAVPLVETGAADAFGFTDEELALACSSHSGSRRHQDVARSMLLKAGCDESSLGCGMSPPLDEDEAAQVTLGLTPQSLVQCECSGAHSGMLAACQHMGWPTSTYTEFNHPLQQKIAQFLAAVSRIPVSSLEPVSDGCSIPTYATSLQSIARAYATLADAGNAVGSVTDQQREAMLRLRHAMANHPGLISAEGDVDTTIMQLSDGRIIAKLGAEGMLCMAIPDSGLGIAIRESSGASRALGPIAVAVLESLGTEPVSVLARLREALVEPVRTFSGEIVGELRTTVSISPRQPTH